jgi:hypothetical protein
MMGWDELRDWITWGLIVATTILLALVAVCVLVIAVCQLVIYMFRRGLRAGTNVSIYLAYLNINMSHQCA